MYKGNTLDTTPDTSQVKSKDYSKNVNHYLQLIEDNEDDKSARDAKNITIRDMVEKGFVIEELNGPRRINVKKLYQVWLKAVQRIRVLDYTLHGVNVPEHVEEVVTRGVSTILRKGDYIKMFRDKSGLFQNGLGYGYAFGMFGTRDDKGSTKGFPFKFTALPNDSVYIDSRATAMRSGNKPVTRAGIVTTFTYDELIKKWPDAKGKVLPGMIPRTSSDRDLDQSESQDDRNEETVEVFYGWDIVHRDYTVFAGRNCYQLENKTGKEYPYVFDNIDFGEEEAYIPILHFTCIPSFKGFYDHGIFEAIYDLALLYSKVLNMLSNQAIDPSNFMKFFTTPQGQASKIFKKIDTAARHMARGKSGVVALEYDPNNPNAGQVGVQSLQIQSMMAEATALFDRIDLEVKRFGLQLDEPEGDALATEIRADEENANRLIKFIMETNASEMEYFLKIVLDQIPKNIKPDKVNKETGEFTPGDQTPILITTKIRVPLQDGGEEEIMPPAITLGMLSRELSEHEYFVKMNEKSGADISKLRAGQIARVLERTPPGTPAYFELLAQFAQMFDIDQGPQAFGAQVGPAAQAPGGSIPEAAAIGATEPQTFNVGAATQQPII